MREQKVARKGKWLINLVVTERKFFSMHSINTYGFQFFFAVAFWRRVKWNGRNNLIHRHIYCMPCHAMLVKEPIIEERKKT